MQVVLVQEEKSYVHNEGIARFRGNSRNSPLSRERSRAHSGPRKRVKREILLMAHFEVAWRGTQQRRADDIQHCPICNERTIFRGVPLGHALTHCKQLRRNYDY
jgi:hypothetical protein